MCAAGHNNRPELLSLLVDRTPTAHIHERTAHRMTNVQQDPDDQGVTAA
jgi:nitrilase